MKNKAQELYLQLNEKIIDHFENEGSKPGCRQRPDLFFPEDFYEPTARFVVERIAKKICGNCPVTQLCLTYALSAREQAGIWGGMTTRERGNILRK